MWRREVIRLVLACNWIVAGLSFGMAVYGYGRVWLLTSHDLVLAERGEPIQRGVVWYREEDRPREEEYRVLTEPLFRTGNGGWWLACGASFGTAVLLMIAFPKKQPTGEPGA